MRLRKPPRLRSGARKLREVMKRKGKDTNDIPNDELSAAIDRWIKGERNRQILKRRLIDCICFEPLAEEFDLSVRQTKNIIYKCEQQLFKHI